MKYMVAIAHFLSEKEIFSPLFWKVKPFFSYHSEARKAKDHEFDMPVNSDALATIIGSVFGASMIRTWHPFQPYQFDVYCTLLFGRNLRAHAAANIQAILDKF